MSWFVASLRENPELAIFLTLAMGFQIGRLRIGTFTLGNVVGTLLAGVLVGQLDIHVDPIVKVVFFDLFLFATGYKVGPQFVRGLHKNALSQVLLTLVATGTFRRVSSRKSCGCGSASRWSSTIGPRRAESSPRRLPRVPHPTAIPCCGLSTDRSRTRRISTRTWATIL